MGRKAQYAVKLSIEQRAEAKRVSVSKSKKISGETKGRAKVLLHLDECGERPLSPTEVAKKVKLHRETVYDIRKQFCIEGFEAALYRKVRETPPTPPKVTGDIEARIIAIAC